VGLGTSSPTTSLTLGTGTTGVSFQSGSLALNSGKIAVIKPIELGTGNGHLVFETYEGGSGGGERMRIDSSGRVGIGCSPDTTLHIESANGVKSEINLSQTAVTNYRISVPASTDALTFVYGVSTERMRIDSLGRLLVGTTTSGGGKSTFLVADGGNGIQITNTSGTASYNAMAFYNNGTTFTNTGSITVSGATTAYNTSSDERLKENITDANDAGDKIDAIKVRQYDWKADGSHQDYGMVAQELMTVAPEAVSGDPESDEMMGVDYSKLVPMLIKEVQSLRARVAQLEGAN